jgi:hypothetical protein
MTLEEGILTFEVVGGSSTTWGSFGGQGYLKSRLYTARENLNEYNPEVSVANSRVGYAANRVQSLILRRVRAFAADGQVIEDNTPKIVHQQ